jgi:hypothetical protein
MQHEFFLAALFTFFGCSNRDCSSAFLLVFLSYFFERHKTLLLYRSAKLAGSVKAIEQFIFCLDAES